MCIKSLRRQDPLEQEMALHSSILAWKIPWAEEPGGLQSMGLQKEFGHDLVNKQTKNTVIRIYTRSPEHNTLEQLPWTKAIPPLAPFKIHCSRRVGG